MTSRKRTKTVRFTAALQAAIGLAVAASLLPVRTAAAAELGHYLPGAFNLRDYFVPPTGVYAALYSLYYHSDTLRDRNGNGTDTITIGGRTVTTKTNINTYSLAPGITWSTGWKILGADYAALAVLPVGGTALQSAFSTQVGFGRETDNSAFGLQDMYVQPVWLGWKWPEAAISASYGFYAPTGPFTPGATDNTGLGFWTHQFQLSGAWYLMEHEALALIGVLTYEIHEKKEDTDITPGEHLTLNYGISQYLPLGGNIGELALVGYSQWQVSQDSGADVPDFSRGAKNQVHAIGLQAGYTIPTWRLSITGKFLYEYYAEARIKGEIATLSFAYQF